MPGAFKSLLNGLTLTLGYLLMPLLITSSKVLLMCVSLFSFLCTAFVLSISYALSFSQWFFMCGAQLCKVQQCNIYWYSICLDHGRLFLLLFCSIMEKKMFIIQRFIILFCIWYFISALTSECSIMYWFKTNQTKNYCI